MYVYSLREFLEREEAGLRHLELLHDGQQRFVQRARPLQQVSHTRRARETALPETERRQC